MKKSFIMILMLMIISLALIGFVSASIVINEVYPDPSGTETGGEAIELYNNGNTTVDISGLVVKTKSSAADAVLPEGSFIAPGGYFLITDFDFNELRDNISWVDSDYEEAMTFTNTDGGVSIVLNDEILDSVAWGDDSVVPTEFIEGEILGVPSEGLSFYRSIDGVDTDDNFNDFLLGEPNFRNSNYREKLDNSINVFLNVIDVHTYIDFFGIIDDDLLDVGTQIVPVPGSKKELLVFADVKKDNFSIDYFVSNIGGDEYDFIFNNSINDTHDRYLSTIIMNYYDNPQDYVVNINLINNNSLSSNYNLSFEYMSLRAIEIDATDFSCDITQGNSCQFLGDSDFETQNFSTIRNIGNVDTNIIVKPEAIFNQNDNTVEYPYSQIEFDLGGIKQTLNSEGVISIETIPSGKNSFVPLEFSFAAPENLKAGNYEGRIKIIATE